MENSLGAGRLDFGAQADRPVGLTKMASHARVSERGALMSGGQVRLGGGPISRGRADRRERAAELREHAPHRAPLRETGVAQGSLERATRAREITGRAMGGGHRESRSSR